LARTSLDRNLKHIEEIVRVELGESEGNEFASQSLHTTIDCVLPGYEAFHLYETFGLPLDFMVDAARDAGVRFDEAGFEAARAEEQARARASWKGGSQKSASPAYRELPKTDFLGYKQLTAPGAEVLAIVKDGVGVPPAIWSMLSSIRRASMAIRAGRRAIRAGSPRRTGIRPWPRFRAACCRCKG
jgi:alanyl-tRNA synthetase